MAGIPWNGTSEAQRDAATEAPVAAVEPRPRFFYGWVIVAVMAVTGGLTMGMGSLNFGLFIKPMGDELGVGRAIFGWTQSARQITSATTAPLVGSLIDRFGVRIMLAVAALLCGGAMVGLALVNDGWQIVALFALMGVVGMNGPGALVTTVPVTKWFVRNRGRAMAYTSLGVPLGGFLLVPLTQIFIDEYGWRAAWVILARDRGRADRADVADLHATPAGGHGPAPGWSVAARGGPSSRPFRPASLVRASASRRALLDTGRGDPNGDVLEAGVRVRAGDAGVEQRRQSTGSPASWIAAWTRT